MITIHSSKNNQLSLNLSDWHNGIWTTELLADDVIWLWKYADLLEYQNLALVFRFFTSYFPHVREWNLSLLFFWHSDATLIMNADNLFYFKSDITTTALRHVPVVKNVRKLLWSRIKSPGIHLLGGLNAPVKKFHFTIGYLLDGYQSWSIIYPFNPIPCLHPSIPPSHTNQKNEGCRCSIIPGSINFLFSIS